MTSLKEEQSNYNNINKDVIDRLGKELLQLREERDEFGQNVQDFKTELTKCRQTISELENQLASTLDTLQTTAEKLEVTERSNLELSGRVNEYTEHIQILESALASQRNQYHHLEMEKEALDAIVNKSWMNREDQEHTKAKIAELEDKVSSLSAENRSLEQLLSLARMEADNATMNMFAEKDNWAQEIEGLRTQAALFQHEKTDLNLEIINMQNLCRDLQQELNQDKSSLSELRNLKSELESKLTETEQDNAHLREQLEILELEYNKVATDKDEGIIVSKDFVFTASQSYSNPWGR